MTTTCQPHRPQLCLTIRNVMIPPRAVGTLIQIHLLLILPFMFLPVAIGVAVPASLLILLLQQTEENKPCCVCASVRRQSCKLQCVLAWYLLAMLRLAPGGPLSALLFLCKCLPNLHFPRQSAATPEHILQSESWETIPEVLEADNTKHQMGATLPCTMPCDVCEVGVCKKIRHPVCHPHVCRECFGNFRV